MRLAALGPWWDRGTRWWGERSRREAVLLAILGALAAIALLVIAVIRPLAAERAQAQADIGRYAMLDARLRAAHGGRPAAAASGPPSAIVAQAAAATGLTIGRIEQEGGRLRVAFADAPFDAVLRWIAAIEQTSTLRVSEARIDRGTTGAGGVSSSFLLTP